MKIALSSDHSGFEQLKDLQAYLEQLGYECQNFGPTKLDIADDYPDYIFPAAQAVSNGSCEKGIILGSSGQGEAMVANRLKGVRCGVFYGPAVVGRVIDANGRISSSPYEIIKLTRMHNDANMLSIAARFVSLADIKMAVKLWLDTPFSNEPRHVRRINKIDKQSS
ncbi:MAG TPA: RpiB/LacA/LacB family sugar-phosphate isomerase [Candidatus Saccharimonadales bacterium]|nr:RpiB/LacA/LacB family sugar-phosphate isomerase [Candidatus Saccharimonadales bacterium]